MLRSHHSCRQRNRCRQYKRQREPTKPRAKQASRREAGWHQAGLGACKAPEGHYKGCEDSAGGGNGEVPGCDEGTHRGQHRAARPDGGPNRPRVSTYGSDVESPMAAAMEQLLLLVARAWAPGAPQVDSLEEALQSSRAGNRPVGPIHPISSDTDANMEGDPSPPASTKRPTDLADDLHKARDEARSVLPTSQCQQC